MDDAGKPSSAPWGTQTGGSYLSVAMRWLALFGPRPAFIFSTCRRDTEWLEWSEEGRHHGLARFAVGPDGLIDEEPVQAAPRKKPCQVSGRQWGRC